MTSVVLRCDQLYMTQRGVVHLCLGVKKADKTLWPKAICYVFLSRMNFCTFFQHYSYLGPSSYRSTNSVEF